MAEKKGNSQQRRKIILEHLNEFGSFGLSRDLIIQISEEFGCSERMIYTDIQVILSQMEFPEIDKLTKKFHHSLDYIMRAAHKLTIHKDPNIQIKGLNLLNQTIANYTSFLENYGFKEKLDAKLAIQTMSDNSITKIAGILK